MTAPNDISAIQDLLGRARVRIRLQHALDGITTATIFAAITAGVGRIGVWTGQLSTWTGVGLLVAAGAMLVIGGVIGALLPLDDERIARRIDRASNLSDRLSTAIAFQRALAVRRPDDPDTAELMDAAIKDGVRAAPRANLKAATAFTAPRHLVAAAGATAALVVISIVLTLFAFPRADRTPRLFAVDPDHARPGELVVLRGRNLMTGVRTEVASTGAIGAVVASPGPIVAGDREPGFVPTNAWVTIGPAAQAIRIEIVDWTATTIRARVPADSPLGDTEIAVHIADRLVGALPFTVVSLTDPNYFQPDAVVLDPDERAYVDSILAQLKELAKREHIEDLDKFIAKIEQLLSDVQQGKLTKEQLLKELAKAEQLLSEHAEPEPAEVAKQLAELGKQLQNSELTKQLGKALQKNDLDKAKQELEELARKLEKSALQKQLEQLEKQLQDPKLTAQQKRDLQKKIDELKKELNKDLEDLEKKLQDPKLTDQERKELQQKLQQLKQEKPLTEPQKQELQKQLQKVSEQMKQQQAKQQQQQQQQQQQLEKQIRRLEKQRDQAKTEQERLTAERQLQKKRDELRKLQKQNDQKNQSAQREALKRLQRDLEKAAEQLQKPNQQESEQDQAERERQASRKIKDAARETGRVDRDRRKQAARRKMASQMEQLREAMRRAKQRGKKGPRDPFAKNAKNRDFGRRARGGHGSRQAWKPGQGQQPGGQGKRPGGKQWGVGHDDDLVGDSTSKSGNTKDTDLTGEVGARGTSRRETILAAAQKGFASTSYQKIYQDYERIVEEVMRNEKMPSSYRYYVKRYFAKIHPSGAPESLPEGNH